MVEGKRNGESRLAWILSAMLALLSLPHAPIAAWAQTEVSSGYRLTDEMRARLLKRGDLTLRDATFVEAMFAIRKVWDVNIVVGNDLKEQTVSCEFVDTELHEILDTILIPRGYGYRLSGKSLIITSQENMKAMKPLFQTATVPVMYANPKEVMEAVTFYLSENGKLQVVESAKRLVVIDYPDRIEQIMVKAQELDEAARTLGYGGPSLSEIERQAIARGNAAAGATGPNATNNGNSALGNGTNMVGSALPGANNKAAFFDLKHVKAEMVLPTLQPLLGPAGKISALPKDNRLVAVDSPERLLLIAQAVRELDVPRPQVRIAALIYDASLEDIRKLGVNWNKTGFHGQNLTSNGVAQDNVLLDAMNAAIPAAGATNGALTISSLGSTFDVHAVIQALAQSKQSRLLADPAVTVYDQEEARIEIVTEIPFQQLTQGANGSNIGTTAFREAGVSLIVTPQISDDQTITMKVNPRFSLLTGFTPGTNQPIIDRRETNTTVRIRNRETLVIGGLRQKNSINARNGVPFLMDLHWPIGELFKQKDVTAKDSELVVFITPELLDLNYMGLCRENDIYNAAMPTLDQIQAPAIPLPPCDLEYWKHRCGCKHCKKGGHDGPCIVKQRADLPPPTMIQETPVYPEQLPAPMPVLESGQGSEIQTSPVPRDPARLSLPPRPSDAPQIPTTDHPQGQETRWPSLRPAQVEATARRQRVATPPLPEQAVQMQVADVSLAAQIHRLPAVEPESPQMAQRLTPRDIFRPLPPVGQVKRR
jgi:type II secretory pathway component GspD/PulD (secretin)